MRFPRVLPPVALLSASIALTTTLVSRSSGAVECQPDHGLSTCVDGDNLWAHPGPRRLFSVGSGLTTAPGQLSFELLLSYLSRPVGVRIGSPDPAGTELFLVDNQLDASFLLALGVTDQLELTLAAPVTLLQDGSGVGEVIGSTEELQRSAIRDARFGYAFALLPRSRAGDRDGLAVTHRFEITIPVGDTSSFAGTGKVGAVPTVAAEYQTGRWMLAAEAGARIRDDASFATAHWGTQLVGSLGAGYDVLDGGLLSVGAEAFALYTVISQPPPAGAPEESGDPLVPAEWILSVRTAPFLGRDVAFTAGGGGSIPFSSEPAFTSPRFRFDLGVAYTPQAFDADGDSIPDRDDQCVDSPEDRDGFEDADGCPDRDNDGDEIPDELDRCRDAPETVDGYRDEDGCPDDDDDGDGVPDDRDQCRNDKEDFDRFEDTDGCPDPDNDEDGIPDASDRCPNGAEDKDGFKDDDGCPDPDNDVDRVPDQDDLCPSEAEDRDGFQDDDGCPDPDNDEDGVPDRSDQCPNEPETLDGESDDDGCPEPGAKSAVRWQGDRVVVDGMGRFRPGSVEPTPELAKHLRLVAMLARSHAPLDVVIVEAYPDRPGDESDAAADLAARRAEYVRDVLVAGGIDSSIVTAAAGDPGQRKRPQDPQVEVTARRAKPRSPTANKDDTP